MAVAIDLDAERDRRRTRKKRDPRTAAILAREARIREALPVAKHRRDPAAVSLEVLEAMRDEIAAVVRRAGDARLARVRAGDPPPQALREWYGPAYPAYLRLQALNWAILMFEMQIGAGNRGWADHVIPPIGL